MIQRPHVDWFLLAPSNALLAASAICLLGAVLFPSGSRRAATAVVCAAGFITAFVFALLLFVKSPHAHQDIGLAVIRDRWGALSAMIVGGAVGPEDRDLRPAELAIVVPLVACLLALSAWPAAISERAFASDSAKPKSRIVVTVSNGRGAGSLGPYDAGSQP